MSETKKELTASDDMIARVNETISNIVKNIEKNEDIRKALSYFGDLRQRIRAMAEVYETTENLFVSFLMWKIIAEIATDYAGNKDEWYVLNKEIIKKFSPALKEFLESLAEDFEEKNYNKILDHAAEFVFKHQKIRSGLILLTG